MGGGRSRLCTRPRVSTPRRMLGRRRATADKGLHAAGGENVTETLGVTRSRCLCYIVVRHDAASRQCPLRDAGAAARGYVSACGSVVAPSSSTSSGCASNAVGCCARPCTMVHGDPAPSHRAAHEDAQRCAPLRCRGGPALARTDRSRPSNRPHPPAHRPPPTGQAREDGEHEQGGIMQEITGETLRGIWRPRVDASATAVIDGRIIVSRVSSSAPRSRRAAAGSQ